MKHKKLTIGIAAAAMILLAFYTYWLRDTRIEIPEENEMFLVYEKQFNGEITDSDMKESIIEIIEGFQVRRNIFGEYLPVGNFTKQEGNIWITIRAVDKPELYEVYIRANGKSFLNIPGKGKFIIEDKETLLAYLEKGL